MKAKFITAMIACKSHKEEAIPLLHNLLGGKAGASFRDGDHWTMPFIVGRTYIEVFQTRDPEGPTAKLVNERGGGLVGLIIGVDNLDEAIKEAEAAGYKIVGRHRFEPVPFTMIDGTEWYQTATIDPAQTFGIRFTLGETKP
jgi:hypothetical protein